MPLILYIYMIIVTIHDAKFSKESFLYLAPLTPQNWRSAPPPVLYFLFCAPVFWSMICFQQESLNPSLRTGSEPVVRDGTSLTTCPSRSLGTGNLNISYILLHAFFWLIVNYNLKYIHNYWSFIRFKSQYYILSLCNTSFSGACFYRLASTCCERLNGKKGGPVHN